MLVFGGVIFTVTDGEMIQFDSFFWVNLERLNSPVEVRGPSCQDAPEIHMLEAFFNQKTLKRLEIVFCICKLNIQTMFRINILFFMYISMYTYIYLGGGFKHFQFSPLHGEDYHFD